MKPISKHHLKLIFYQPQLELANLNVNLNLNQSLPTAVLLPILAWVDK